MAGLTRPDLAGHDRVVPPTGFTAQLTVFTAGAMAFLAVFALALALATGRLAERWSTELAQSVTVRVSAPEDQLDQQTLAVMEVLKTTPASPVRACCPMTRWKSCWSPGSAPMSRSRRCRCRA